MGRSHPSAPLTFSFLFFFLLLLCDVRADRVRLPAADLALVWVFAEPDDAPSLLLLRFFPI
jgi:hypothetical protein